MRYILTVCDFEVCGLFMKTVRTYSSKSLSAIRFKEKKLARKKMKNRFHRENISNWGSEIHNGPSFNPIRTLTITCKG